MSGSSSKACLRAKVPIRSFFTPEVLVVRIRFSPSIEKGRSGSDPFVEGRYAVVGNCVENQALNPFIDHTHRILSAHGFTVVPTPAIFSAPGKGINFLQALTGKAPSTKTPFFITTGVSTGSALGTHLMEAFKLFLLNLDPSTSVHFIGKDPDGSFTTVMGLWDKHLAGIRTLAFPVDPM